MTGEGKYQGWTNWETWHTALLIDNERGIYDKKVELVKRKASLSEFKRGLKEAETLTKKFWKESSKDNPEGWGKKFDKVNWNEIYKNMIDEEY